MNLEQGFVLFKVLARAGGQWSHTDHICRRSPTFVLLSAYADTGYDVGER